MGKTTDQLKQKITELPANPGIYQFLDTEGNIIYIGKARNLKKRVQSYFTKSFDNRKTAVMVSKITDLKFMVVETEFDAFLLENSLIKKYQPRYNIQLRDDKSFPWICIKNERFPRVFGMRNPVSDGSEYHGPYANVKVMNTVLDLASKLYPIRNCNFHLSGENIAAKKFRVCLEYQIGNCLGPCEGFQNEQEYNESINQIRQILKGNVSEVIHHLKAQMQAFSAKHAFEKAELIKQKLQRLEAFQAKSTVVNPRISHVDVFAIQTDDNHSFVNYLRVVQGAIVQTHTIEVKKQLDESPEEMLSFAITDLRNRLKSSAREVIVPLKIESDGQFSVTVPERGDRKKLLDLADRNVRYYMLEKHRQKETRTSKSDDRAERILTRLQKDLRMKELPVHIECFDNSNIQGSDPVAAMVVFRSALPAKKDYRHFNIRTVEGPDDFASMEEIITRRYGRLMREKLPLPQLIIVDGGKGQLNAALKALKELGLKGKMAVIGIAKRLEEIYFPGDPVPLYLDKKSESLRLIQHMRNEAHRFGITHHRKKRVKNSLTSELDAIPGIGPKTRTTLLKSFKSVHQLKKASIEEITAVIGPAKASLVFRTLHPE